MAGSGSASLPAWRYSCSPWRWAPCCSGCSRPDTVSSRTILGAISVYTALGILFTWAYGLIDRIEGGGFFGQVPTEGGDFLFFSYTTLTTTGYGNLVPVGQVGRMISGLEMMLGQVFLVTLVAGLVSLWRPGEGILRRRERRGGNDTTDSAGAV